MKNLGLGLMRLPCNGESHNINYEAATQMVDKFIASGFCYFDTAYIYHSGNSEHFVKTALTDRYPRDSFILADKMPTFAVKSSADYPKFFEEQLNRCGIDYFDYYLLHCLNRDLYKKTKRFGGFEFMSQKKAEGSARKIGFSFHDTADVLDQILTEQPQMEFVQLQINYADWESPAIQSRLCYEVALKHGKPIIVMEPIKGGSLANLPAFAQDALRGLDDNASTASWAIRFAASLPSVFMVLSGMTTMEQLVDNMGYMSNFVPLTADEIDTIHKVGEAISNNKTVPCTSCRYCVDNCPAKISIPEMFSLYNEHATFGWKFQQQSFYKQLSDKGGKASDCLRCGQCQKHCPQHIKIVDHLGELAKIYEKK